MNSLERFEKKYTPEPNTGCWLWSGTVSTNGYGQIRIDGKNRTAHRWYWENLHGPVPDGLELDHLCGVRSCVRPDHLEAVTHRENLRRGKGWRYHARKTHCPKGHTYDNANTYRAPMAEGMQSRACRTCRAEEGRARNAAKGRGPNNAEKTRCKHGHEFTEENTYRFRTAAGYVLRHCRKCMRRRVVDFYDRKRAAAHR